MVNKISFSKYKISGKYGIIGKSVLLKNIYNKIDKLAKNEATVIITGPTGSGKELVAQAIHQQSKRRCKPFVALNCGGIPNDLFESELFGYEKGAFTSAWDSKPGKFELAQGGTIFLDEIGNLPLSLQAKLLRVLQEKEIERLGGIGTKTINVRIIAATNVDLKKEIQNGNFREDLYHRLNVVPINLPALHIRKEDLELLIPFFIKKFSKEYRNSFKYIECRALEALKKHTWPGNIRELKHLLERIVALEAGPILKYEYLPIEFHALLQSKSQKESTLTNMIENFTMRLITDALKSYDGNRSKAAQFLGIKRSTLLYKMKQYDLENAYIN
ncbi:MAG: sigma-54 dependent transcriptional regulator [Candidatus Margulisbacteria bacterium]|nr:sigma-54 dependent transcriptional regulator [Candidatus Margulisiibacteriota bacterium]